MDSEAFNSNNEKINEEESHLESKKSNQRCVKDIESPTEIINVPKAILMLFNDHVEESIIGNSRVKCCYNEKNDEIDVDVENDEIDVDMYE